MPGDDESNKRNFVSGSDFFSQPPPNPDQTASTSMGHASGTQQLYPGGRRNTNQQAANPHNYDINTLYQPINFFGIEVKLFVVLIIAGGAFYVWGLPGVLGLGVAYWLSKTFQQQQPEQREQQQQQQNQNSSNFQPVNRDNVAPPAPLRSSTNPDRFPGKGFTLS